MKKKLKDLTAKEIYTTCDKHNAGNKCSRDCPFFLTERIHKCTTSYMKENPNEEIEISFTMTDREYAQYLFDWLRFDSSEDVCAKCANCPKDDFCPNADQNSVDFDYNTCFYGMKQYAEEHANKK